MMHPPWQFVVLLLSACIMLPLAVVIWRNWDIPTARPLAMALILCAGWCLIAALDISTEALSDKILLFRLRLSFLPFVPTLVLEAYYRYAKGKRLLVGWKLIAILVIPIASVALVWLPGRLFCYDFRLGHAGSFSILIFSRGPANVIYYSYCTAIAVWAMMLMVATWAQSPPWMRRGSLLFIVIYLVPATSDFLFVTGWSPTPGFNYTPLAYAVSSSLLAWVLFGERILSLGPVARTALIEHLEELLIVLDHSGRVIDVNAAAANALGTSSEKLFGKPAKTVLCDWPDVLALFGFDRIENREVRLGSEKSAWECSIYSVPREGPPRARLVLLRNVTERKRIEEELLRAKEAAESSNRAKSAFLAMVSHEIRTPMGGVIGFAQMLEQTPLNPDQQEYVKMLLTSGQAQLRIIDDILDYSKVEAGRMELEEHSFPLRSEIEKNCLLLRSQATTKGISFLWKIADDVPDVVKGDSLRIGQILINLIGNAIKFTSHGNVTLTVDAESISQEISRIRFIVSDTGSGIPKAAIPRMFQSFSQADSSTARRHGGTGLGLAITKRLCNLMDGDVTVESQEGEGSTFVATIDLKIDERPYHRKLPTASLEQGKRPLSILVVEDNLINQRLAQAMLEKMGHKVTLSDSGVSAVRILEKQNFDVVFMDIEMPEIDGFETVSRIRELESSGKISKRNHIVALTAHAISGNRERCLAGGMDDYVTKPFLFDALKAALQKCP